MRVFLKVSLLGVIRISDVTCPPKEHHGAEGGQQGDHTPRKQGRVDQGSGGRPGAGFISVSARAGIRPGFVTD